MRTRFLGSLGGLLAGAGLAWAQPPAPPANPAADVAVAPAGHTGDVIVQAPVDCSECPEAPSPHAYNLLCQQGNQGRDLDYWVGAEYLHWWTRQPTITTPLVTTGPAGSLGILNRPGVSVIAGNEEIDYGPMSGGRLTAGVGIPDFGLGLDGSVFILERGGSSFLRTSDAGGTQTLARPVVDALTGLETSSLIASPGAFAGSVSVDTSSQLWGGEVNLVRARVDKNCFYADWLFGFRYMDLDEELSITQRSTLLPNGVTGFNGGVVRAPAVIGLADTVRVKNDFYGGQIGVQGEYRRNGFFIYGAGKFAVGNTHTNVDLAGTTALFVPGQAAQAVPGGLTVLRNANLAVHSRNNVSFIPEVNVNVGYQFGRHFRVFAGYTFLYWDDLQRPYDQVVRVVNPNLLPSSLSFGRQGGPAVPFEKPVTTDFWAQGVNVGMLFRY
jgi:hypothetical protein